jgi:type III pantothenate kinase
MLLIDCGNSATKCRLIDQDLTWDNTFVPGQSWEIKAFRDFLRLHQPGEIYIASVASEKMTDTVLHEIQTNLPVAHITRILTEPKLGQVTNAYHDYTRLGVDRWLTLLAADVREKTDVIIIDAGSAITIDLLSRQYSHLGGAILPGFKTDQQRFISMFPTLDFNHPDVSNNQAPGRSSEACIQMTQFPITLARIYQLLDEWIVLLQAPVKILLCGQDAPLISEQLERPHEIVSDLVFQGMLQHIQLQG